VTEQCILYTARDAYVRHFPVVVPPGAVAHIDANLGDAALKNDAAQHERGDRARRRVPGIGHPSQLTPFDAVVFGRSVMLTSIPCRPPVVSTFTVS
jgi:hypothetical protein